MVVNFVHRLHERPLARELRVRHTRVRALVPPIVPTPRNLLRHARLPRSRSPTRRADPCERAEW